MIPKILTFIRIGPKDAPEHHKLWAEAWAKLLKDWDVRMLRWEAAPLDQFTHPGPVDNAYERFEAAAESMRYEVLLKDGGFVLDLDIHPRRALDPLIALAGEDMAIAARTKRGSLCPAVLAAPPDHPYIKACIGNIPHCFRKDAGNGNLGAKVVTTTWNPKPHVFRPDVLVLEPPAFFPKWWDEEFDAATLEVSEATYGVHEWATTKTPRITRSPPQPSAEE